MAALGCTSGSDCGRGTRALCRFFLASPYYSRFWRCSASRKPAARSPLSWRGNTTGSTGLCWQQTFPGANNASFWLLCRIGCSKVTSSFSPWCCSPELSAPQFKDVVASPCHSLEALKLPCLAGSRCSKPVVLREFLTPPFVVEGAVARPVAFVLYVEGIRCRRRNPLRFVSCSVSERLPM